jgi:ABC-type nitrate/sulfonate/bicarbonate transport system substrate-binding protein
MHVHRPKVRVIAVVAAVLVLLSACGSSSKSSSAAPASATSSSAGPASTTPAKLTTVTLALDYIANNAGYAGIYAAVQQGLFTQQGLKVNIIPYGSTSADILVNAGQAQFGTIDEASMILDRAAGQPLTSIMDVMQHDPQRLAVAIKDSASVNGPKDLAGKTFGGFGIPMEKVMNDAVIKTAGGTPNYKIVTLGPTVYDELTNGQVDWAIPYETDDILWAKMAGHPWKIFNPLDYGVPDQYAKLFFSSQSYTNDHPDIVKRFVAAVYQGYTWAQQHVSESVQIQSKLVQGTFDISQQTATAQDLAQNYWLDPSGKVGPEVASRWSNYVKFMADGGILKDANGKEITTPPDSSTWFTNQFLPAGVS